jgi:uncharacterized membrane protein
VDWLQILFRIGHIVPAVFWVGGAALFFFYVEPTMNKLGPDAEKFVEEVIVRRKLPIYFAAVSGLTVLFGAILYWRDSNGLSNSTWMTSGTGIVFTLGAIAAIIAWLLGGVALSPAVKKVGAIGGEMRAAGGPPSAELMGRMHAAQERVRTIGAIDLVLVIFAVLCMATARYFS